MEVRGREGMYILVNKGGRVRRNREILLIGWMGGLQIISTVKNFGHVQSKIKNGFLA